jgi:hypothetical protein
MRTSSLSLLAAMAGCAAALAFAGNAHAYVKHKHAVRIAGNQPAGFAEYGERRGYPTQFRIPAHPLIWDCVHVTFPQCSRGYDGLNDGSFR